MKAINILWQPQEKQRLFLSRPEYEVLYGGAAGGGKSDALLCEALRQVDNPDYRALILRKTYPQLTELIDRSAYLYAGAFPNAVYSDTKHCWRFPSGAKISFGSMQYSKDRLNYQGRRFDFIAFDELTQFTWEEYSYMFSRNRPSHTGGKPTLVYMRATANPGGIGHAWVKQRFVTPAPPMTPIVEALPILRPDGSTEYVTRSRIFIPATVFDNRALTGRSPGYLASLAMLPEAEKKALLYGDWSVFSGQVFTEWRDDPAHYADGRFTHVVEPFAIPPSWRVYRGFDFGYTRPFSVGWFAADTKGCLYLFRELYGCDGTPNVGLRHTPSQIAAAIREIEQSDPNLRGREILGIADPSIFDTSRGESIAELMAKHPYYVNWIPGENSRLSGKMQFHNRLAFDANGECMLRVFSTCREFIRTVPALCYSESRPEDVDTDGEDHIYDMTRYVLMESPVSPPPVVPTRVPAFDPLNQYHNKRGIYGSYQ